MAKSVPFYTEGHSLVAQLSDFFMQNGSTCYELGTSTGVLLRQLAERHAEKEDLNWVGIDVEAEMINQAKQESLALGQNINFVCDDIFLFPYEKSDLIIAYYTVQFVPPYRRQELLSKIYEHLNWGGAFIMFEKVRANDARFQDYMSALYLDYKLDQGYQPDEIIAKSRSLKRVLEPFSSEANIELLKRAGFSDVMSVMKYICFEGFLAIK
ncbi:MAG: methyltransferase domain-containing protein [Thiotrichaceae bacterium]|nr:methyltransferase domain-containing protein [Thiotrichaceae bacterium]